MVPKLRRPRRKDGKDSNSEEHLAIVIVDADTYGFL
jgi:hypothetical protein